MRRVDRGGALLPYREAITRLIQRAIPADPWHPTVILVSDLYGTDAHDVAARMTELHNRRISLSVRERA